jgi:hypothetical protein
MSSIARRGLRTTAAVAGLAALGAGLAAPAFAEAQAAPAKPESPAAPDLSAARGALASLPAPTANPSDLPPLFTFEMPKVETAAPAMPSAGDAVHTDAGVPALPDPTQAMRDNSFGIPTAAPDLSALPTADAMSIAGHAITSSPQGGMLSGN